MNNANCTKYCMFFIEQGNGIDPFHFLSPSFPFLPPSPRFCDIYFPVTVTLTFTSPGALSLEGAI